MNNRRRSRTLAGVLAVLLGAATLFGAGPGSAEGGVRANATIENRAIAGANAGNPVRLDPTKITQVVVEVVNGTSKSVTVRRVDLTGHVLGLNFFSYSTSVELTVAAGKTEKLTYRLDPAGLDGQATGLIGADLTLIGTDGKPLASQHTVIDVRGSLLSVYGLFGIILAVLTALAIADAALTVARHRLSVNRWQRGLRLLAPGVGIGLMIGFTASIARWWVPGTPLWLSLAGVTAAIFFLAGYLSPTPRTPGDLGLDAEDLAAARELDAHGYPAQNTPDLARSAAPGAGGYWGGAPDLPTTATPDLPTTAIPGSAGYRSGGIPSHGPATNPGAGYGPGGTPILSPDELETLGYPAGSARSREAAEAGRSAEPGGAGPMAASSPESAGTGPGSGPTPVVWPPGGPRDSGSRGADPGGPGGPEGAGAQPRSGPNPVAWKPAPKPPPSSRVVRPVVAEGSGSAADEETIGRETGPRAPVPAGEDEPTIRNAPEEWRFRPGGAGR